MAKGTHEDGRGDAGRANEAKGGQRQANAPKVGFEAARWAAADKLRGNMNAAEYQYLGLGLIFLKHVSGYGG